MSLTTKIPIALTMVLGLVVVVSDVSAADINSTLVGDTCRPPASDCITIKIKTVAVHRGQMAYATMNEITSMSEEELVAKYQAEYIVAADVQPLSGSSGAVSSSASNVRGQSIGF